MTRFLMFLPQTVDPLPMSKVKKPSKKGQASLNSLIYSFFIFSLCACASTPRLSEDKIKMQLAQALEKQKPKVSHHEQISPKKMSEAERKKLLSAEYHFGMAQAYSTGGHVDQAIEEYKLVIMYDPDSALVHLRLAAEYVKKGSLSDALTSCKEAVRIDAKLVDARLMLAGLYSSARENDEALKQYDQILKIDTGNDEAAVYRAQILLEKDQPQKAVKSLRAFIQLNKKNRNSAAGWYYLGRIEQQLGNTTSSERAYIKSLSIQKTFYQAALALGSLYESKKNEKKALKTYEKFYEQYQHQGIASKIATIYLKQERYQEAIPFLETIRASDPNDMNVRVKLGLVHMELKAYPNAIEIFNEILVKNPASERVLYYLGSLYEEMGNYKKAIAQLNKIGHESKFYEDSALHVTYLLKKLDRKSEARAVIQEAIKKAPNFSAFYIFNASLDEDANDLDSAISILEKAKGRFPGNDKIRYYLGSLYDRTGNIKKSLEEMEKILETNPKHADALNYIAYTWTVQGIHLEEAEAYIRRALKIRPDNGYIIDSLGWNLFARGKVKEAVPYLEKASQMKPGEATILDHLADAYLKANLQKKALVQYRKAFDAASDKTLKIKINKKIQNLETRMANGNEDARSIAGDSKN